MVGDEKLVTGRYVSQTESREHSLGAQSSAMHSTAGHVELATDLYVSQIHAREHSLGAQPFATVEERRKEEHSRSEAHQSLTPL